jgi:glycosyltransferase involved in cell wall biosynthesis
MRVCFALPSLRPSGGVAVALAHARELARRHGVEAELVVGDRGGDGAIAVGDVPVRGLEQTRGRRYDVAVATWWQTASALWQLDASRRAMLLQSFEQRFYGRDAPFERLSAEATLALPIAYIAVAPWLRDLLTWLRPDARCSVVPPGIDKEVFAGASRTRREGPLEVLIEGQPTLPFKGVGEAIAAVRAMGEPVRATLVALDAGAAGDVGADRVVGGLDAAGMAALYRESDVLVKLSRVEGLGLAPVEGFHCGLPCIVTPFTGHEEYARHGENGVVVGFDDVPGTAAWLDLLARDRDLLARLSNGARATAERWPSQEESTRTLHRALLELAEGEPPAADERLLMRTLALNSELGRARLSRQGAATEQALTSAEALVRELSDSRDECAERLEETKAELARIKSTRAYRVASALKRLGTRR